MLYINALFSHLRHSCLIAVQQARLCMGFSGLGWKGIMPHGQLMLAMRLRVVWAVGCYGFASYLKIRAWSLWA
jgi:hypothetical protein